MNCCIDRGYVLKCAPQSKRARRREAVACCWIVFDFQYKNNALYDIRYDVTQRQVYHMIRMIYVTRSIFFLGTWKYFFLGKSLSRPLLNTTDRQMQHTKEERPTITQQSRVFAVLTHSRGESSYCLLCGTQTAGKPKNTCLTRAVVTRYKSSCSRGRK